MRWEVVSVGSRNLGRSSLAGLHGSAVLFAFGGTDTALDTGIV